MDSSIASVLRSGIQVAVDSAAKHLNPATRSELLGPDFAKFACSGTGKSLLGLACYADGLRVVVGVLLADGQISEQELQDAEGFLAEVGAHFEKLRPEYQDCAPFVGANLRRFVDRYRTDGGTFGFKNETTKWAGLTICKNIADRCDDRGALEALSQVLLVAAERMVHADGVHRDEEVFLRQLREELGADSAETESETSESEDYGPLLTLEIAEQFRNDDFAGSLDSFVAIDDAAAESLSRHKGNLDLHGLTSLSDAAAESLSRHEGELWLRPSLRSGGIRRGIGRVR